MKTTANIFCPNINTGKVEKSSKEELLEDPALEIIYTYNQAPCSLTNTGRPTIKNIYS